MLAAPELRGCVRVCVERENVPVDNDRGIIWPIGGRVLGINVAVERPLA